MSEENVICFDVAIVGAGPAGLSAAIRLKQLQPEYSVCIIEKGAEVGAHILSGNVFEPRALDELIPDWKENGAPLNTPATGDRFLFLSKTSSYRLPTPPQMKNHGNYVISLANLCRWLAEQASGLGVEIFTGFAASQIIYEEGRVVGVKTGDVGINKQHEKKDSYQEGVEIRANYTLFAEGCRGSLSEELVRHYDLRAQSQPQTYGIGFKEIWQIAPDKHEAGNITHTVGWPLPSDTYGGSFLYHMDNNQIAVGYVVGLDYKNPYLNPYEEFQRFKLHPAIKPVFENAKRIAYGARALNEGGLQSLPQLIFPGGAVIGCSAGFLNVPKIKGSHTAMKSGMLAAEAICEHLPEKDLVLRSFPKRIDDSWIHDELHLVRNIRPSFRKSLWRGMVYSALDTYVFRGRAPWTFSHHADHTSTEKASMHTPINYPKPDGTITFDRLTSVQLTGTNHEEDQPSHLVLLEEGVAVNVNLKDYAGLEQRYCPASVYEYIDDGAGGQKLQINAQNCIHCKTCDIKDPTQNIRWETPEGGGGPRYPNM